MKTEYTCVLCAETFFANKNTNLKTCFKCRNIKNRKNYTNKKKAIISIYNNNLKTIKITHTNGRYNINRKSDIFSLNNSVANINNKKHYIDYLNKLKIDVETDLKYIESLK